MQGQNTKAFKIIIIIIVAIFLFSRFGGGIILNIIDMLDGKENGPSGINMSIAKDAFEAETKQAVKGLEYGKITGDNITNNVTANSSFLDKISNYSNNPDWFKSFYIISLDPVIVCSTAADDLNIDNYTIKVIEDSSFKQKTYKNYKECINDK